MKAVAATRWREQLDKTYNDAATVRGLLAAESGERIEPDRLAALRHENDAAAGALAQLSATAPDDESRVRTAETEQALSSYMLAIEAEQLLPGDASEDARADANVTRRARATELDDSLARLDAFLHPPPDQ
jgi:hypothetical protein